MEQKPQEEPADGPMEPVLDPVGTVLGIFMGNRLSEDVLPEIDSQTGDDSGLSGAEDSSS